LLDVEPANSILIITIKKQLTMLMATA